MDLLEAEKNQADTLEKMNEQEHEILQRRTRVEELAAKTGKIGAVVASLRVLEARRDALVAENARRHGALAKEVNMPLEDLLNVQARSVARRRAVSCAVSAACAAATGTRLAA
jgi:hypothetical protein